MTDQQRTRRRVLAAAATGLATVVAGCGYQPAGGEFEWEIEFDEQWSSASIGGSLVSDKRWLSDGSHLVFVHNRRGPFIEGEIARVSAYDARGETVWERSAETRYEGAPAVDAGRVYLPLKDGRVTAIEQVSEATRTESAEAKPLWTADWDGSELALAAGDALIVGVHEDGLVALDADDGDERFVIEDESFVHERALVATAEEWVWTVGHNKDDGKPTDPTLYAIGTDGDVRETVSLPAAPDWLETSRARAVVGVDDEVWVVDTDGDRRFSIELDGTTADGEPIIVEGRDRCYHYSSRVLEAIDTEAGEIVWSRDDYSFYGTPAADDDGVYGVGIGPDTTECGLVGVQNSGEPWWGVPMLEDLRCLDEYRLIDDRLVLIDDSRAYGFRKAPGRRLTLLSR